MVLIEVENAPVRLLGALQRRMLEVRAGMFVGNLSKRSIVELWEKVTASSTGSGLLVYAARNELGLTILTYGAHRYRVVDNFGISLIEFRAKKVGELRSGS